MCQYTWPILKSIFQNTTAADLPSAQKILSFSFLSFIFIFDLFNSVDYFIWEKIMREVRVMNKLYIW